MPAQLLGQKPPDPPRPTIHASNEKSFAELEEARAANMELMQQLAGFSIGVDPFLIMHTRIAVIMDALFPSESDAGQAMQIEVELNFEKQMANILSEVRRNAVSAQLQQGARVPPELLEQMAKASGQVPPGFRK